MNKFHGISLPSTTRTPFFFTAVARRAVLDAVAREAHPAALIAARAASPAEPVAALP
eukprot:CAMPEP_0115230928 /NCGR_PEP_ID=MMETSP0270-20121206/32968_1 /TAXON_ID=71861 /ORGANISM="Scrippsiella trochoidea, Strain CCMP3099" /LENGTH=56 /DNA_ID=CAMNT_0002645535 /DNA_START=15 /DNA_END=182 /DNA_ORIENTATION=+